MNDGGVRSTGVRARSDYSVNSVDEDYFSEA